MRPQDNGYRKPHKQRQLWTQHEVDQGFWNGRSRKSRGAAPTHPHVGASVPFNTLRPWEMLEGVGLYVQGDCRVVEVISGETLGYAPIAVAIGYRNAAALKGVTLEVYNEAV